MSTERPTELDVGRVAKPHGLRGEVIVALTTDRTERVDAGATLITDRGPLVVEHSRPHQGRFIVQFEGVIGREGAEALRDVVLRAEAIDDPDALWVHELIGAVVVLPDGSAAGVVDAVLDNPAGDLLVLDGGALVPNAFVVGWHGEGDERRLVIDPPAGLFDL